MSRAAFSMLGALLGASLLAGCGGCDGGDDPAGPDAGVDAPPITFADCDSDTAAWVRNAYLAIVGHRPHGQAEVDVYVQLHDQIAALAKAGTVALDPKEVVARAMTEEPAYRDRWTSHFLDALRVPRLDEQEMSGCYAEREAATSDASIATYVRDNPPTAGGVGARFTGRDLIESAIALDDVTPIYRAHLFTLVTYPIPAANVPPVEAELARREDFGLVFDSAYLNRDLVCLQCHNSELSVTDAVDPVDDRHWPLDGLFEQSLYGASNGIEHARAHAPFRFDGFAASAFGDAGPRRPWGWATACGTFYTSPGADPAGVDGRFGDLTGTQLTVYDLEASLQAGFEALRGRTQSPGAGGVAPPADEAFAYLVSATIVEGVWKEVIGAPLTIANYFPRNEAARDVLQGLTDRFVERGYSLEDLLVAIVSSDYFSRQLPEEGCGDEPYLYPNVFDPWVISDDDEARRRNGPGDGIAAMSARTLMRTAFEALEWPVPDALDFPGGGGEPFCQGLSCPQLANACQQGFCCATYEAQCASGGVDELGFQQGVGAFLKNGDRGFRGLDFQARLAWEDRFGACDGTDDFVADLVAAAEADAAATVGDVVAAVKDRLVGEPAVDATGSPSEADALAGLFGAGLDAPAASVADLEDKVRRLCGALLMSPQFLLSGAAGRGGEVPRLTPATWQFDAVCADVGPRVADFGGSGITVACDGGALTVSPPPAGP